MLFRKAYRDLSRRKLRTFLAVIGLAIAVVGITGFSIATSSVITSAERSMGLNVSPDVYFDVRKTGWNFSYVENVSGLSDYEVTYNLYSSTNLKDKQRILVLRGIDTSRISQARSLAGVLLDEGSLPDPSKDELLFDTSAASAMGLNIGDSLQVFLPSSSGVADVLIDFSISGLARNVQGLGYTFNMQLNAWLPIERLRFLLDEPTVFSNLFVCVEENFSPDKVKDDILDRFQDDDLFVASVTVSSDDDSDMRLTILNMLGSFFSLGTLLGLLIGGVLSASTIQIIVASEKTDISLMKIVGGRRRHVFLLYFFEAMTLGILGSLLGLIFSIIGGKFLLDLLADPLGLPLVVFVIPVDSFILGALLPVITSIFLSFPIIFSALRIPPMEVFRPSSIKYGNKGHSISRFFIFNMSFRNLFRKKTRVFLNIVMLSLAVTGVVGFQIAGDSVVTTLHAYFDKELTDIEVGSPVLENETLIQEYLTSFFDEQYPNDLDCLTTLWWTSSDAYVDGFEDPFRLSLLGVRPESPIYDSYPLIDGSWLSEVNANKNHIVLTERFMSHHLEGSFKVGDSILLSTPLYNESFTIVGVIDDANNNGFMSYVHLSTLQSFFHGKGLIDSVRIMLKDRSRESDIALALTDDPMVQNRGWSVIPMSYWRENNIRQISFFILIGNFLVILCLIIAVIGGTNAFAMAALERESEIGLLKLIGSRFWWIMALFLLEAFYIGLIASVLGIFLGINLIASSVLSLISEEIFTIPMVVTVSHILQGIFVGVVTILLASLYPAFRASRTSVISALRYE